MTPIPVHVTFRGLLHSDALEAEITERAAALERFGPSVTGCRVLVELPHRHRHGGRHFHVRIEVDVRGEAPVVVNHEPSLHGPLKDVQEDAHHKASEIDSVHQHAAVAVRDAFDAAGRRLTEAQQRRRA
jgi:hypothetical protein